MQRPQQRGRDEGCGAVHGVRQGRRTPHQLLPVEVADPALRRQRRTPHNLADLGGQAEQFVSGLDIKPSKAHGSMRAKIRKQLAESEVGQSIEESVNTLLSERLSPTAQAVMPRLLRSVTSPGG